MTKTEDIIGLMKQVIADANLVKATGMNEARVISTNAVTKQLGMTARTVRFYSELGIATPIRRGTTRLFTPDQVRRLKLARDLRGIGMDVKTVMDVLDLLAVPEEATNKLPALTELFSAHTKALLRREEEIRQQYYTSTRLVEHLFNHCKPA